ncbi:MAG: AMP-binding protein [Bacteroidota bacterium]
MAYSFLKDNSDPIVQDCTTYIDVIKKWTVEKPEHVVFRFLQDGVNENESFTYLQLETRSKAVASAMQKKGVKGDRVLLLFQPGLSYVASLYACFYSGFIAVPAYPPRRNKGIDRIHTIITDSEAEICLVSRQVYDDISKSFKGDNLLAGLQWIVYEDIMDNEASLFTETEIVANDVALLQYTSGSTGNAKGVIITQMNILYNSEYIRLSFGLDTSSVGVNWLPIFHDMGLIGGILQAAYVGGVNIGMPPMAFLKRPLNWLRAIEKYGATTAGGPNFSYDYCVQKTSDEECDNLDLSSVKVFFCGAEPIRKSTYAKFIDKFSISKSKEEQLYSCYGMAETTLIVTGGLQSAKPKYLNVDASALKENFVKVISESKENGISLVGCGHTWMETNIEIVDPTTMKKVGENEIGEIWVSGPTVAPGYWNKPEETNRTFGAKLIGSNDRRFLKTGDLGFFHENELYITGRLKDLIIIRGVNHYPNDIEFTIQNANPELRQNSGAAFSITKWDSERLVIVQELERTAMRNTDFDELMDRIRKVVAEDHELEIYSIVLIRAGSIPITSSGKIQRRQTKYEYLRDELSIVAQWKKEEDINPENTLEVTVPTEDLIKEWLVLWIMRNQHFKRDEIDADKNIMSYGIDSLAAVTLETEISKQFGFQWHISSFILNPTINKLAAEGLEIYKEGL